MAGVCAPTVGHDQVQAGGGGSSLSAAEDKRAWAL